MSYLQELLAVNHKDVLSFFVSGLKDVCEKDVDTQELLYNASVLAHYAQTSTRRSNKFPVPTSLVDVFDTFVCGADFIRDSEVAETAGTQCLLLTGFFENQMRKRHSIRWYRDLGANYFSALQLWCTNRLNLDCSIVWHTVLNLGDSDIQN